MNEDPLKVAARVLRDASDIVLTSHVNPDGDSIGSLLGMCIALAAAGARPRAAIPGKGVLPPQYIFMPGQEYLEEASGLPRDCEVFVALDCGKMERLDSLEELALRASTFINIDHHEDNTRFGSLNVVQPEHSSTSEIVFEVLQQAGIPVPREAASCFYTGIMTDTGKFTHENTNPGAFRAAAQLVELGAVPHVCAREVYESQSMQYMRLIGITLERATYLEDLGLIYSYVSREDLEKTGAVLEETEDLIDMLRIAKDTRVAALLKDLEDGQVRVSLRSSDDVDIAWIARKYGGGGHAKAAGFTSPDDREATILTIIEELRKERA